MALAKRYTISPMWTGLTGVVICSGPSLSVKQARAIARARNAPGSKLRVITVNDAIYAAWYSDWLHACDLGWWEKNIRFVYGFKGIKTTLSPDCPAPWVSGYLLNSGLDGFDEDPTACRNGRTSAYQAMCALMHAGVKRILLVGMDMKPADSGESHFFGSHPNSRKVNFSKAMVPHFETLLPALRSRGIEVWNCTPDSALATFPAADLETMLGKGDGET